MKARKLWVSSAFALLVLLIGAAAGVMVTIVIAAPSAPPTLAEAERPEWLGVTTQPSDDPRKFDVVVQEGATVALRAPVTGLVTEMRCDQGQVWKSGESTVTIDGTRLLLLHTAIPLWRALTPGTKGADAVAVKGELARLGLAPSSGDALEWRDLDAARTLFAASGVSIDPESLNTDQVIWLPTPEVSPSNCAAVGTPMNAGDVLGETTPTVMVQLGDIPALQAGLRELLIDRVVIPLTDQLTPQDPSGLSAILSTPSYRSESA